MSIERQMEQNNSKRYVNMAIILRFACTAAILIALSCSASLAATQQISFQGRLTDNFGTPEVGQKNVSFKLYDSAAGVVPVVTITRPVTCDTDGIFSTMLDLSANFDGSDRWLEVQVAGDAAMAPREKTASVPYAYRAAVAESAGGAVVTTVATSGSTGISGNVLFAGGSGIKVTQSGQKITVSSEAVGGSGFVSKSGDRITGKLTVEGGSIYAAYIYGNGAALKNITGGINKSQGDAYYINTTGDTMTGALNLPANSLSAAGNQIVLLSDSVGIGAPTMLSKLAVSGVIESTSGGIKFPDASIQTSAWTASSTGGWNRNSGTGVVSLLNNNDLVGIGMTPLGSYRLDVTGGFRANNGLTVASGTVSFPTGSINGVRIKDNTITTAKITDGSVTGADILDNSLTSTNFQLGGIQNADIAAAGIGGAAVAANTLGESYIADNAVSQYKFYSGAVTAGKLGADSVDGDVLYKYFGTWSLNADLTIGCLTIDYNYGRIGINNSNPQEECDVSGSVYASGNPPLTGVVFGSQSVSFTSGQGSLILPGGSHKIVVWAGTYNSFYSYQLNKYDDLTSNPNEIILYAYEPYTGTSASGISLTVYYVQVP